MNLPIFRPLLFFLISLIVSCSSPAPPSQENWLYISGRSTTEGKRIPLFRALVPKDWILEPSKETFLEDTKLPLCTLIAPSPFGNVSLFIHNFPSYSLEDRVPPEAQVNRWKNQLKPLDNSSLSITPQAFGGYSGLLLKAKGIKDEKPTAILAWAMQLGYEPYQSLSHFDNHELLADLRGDITLKALGPPKAIDDLQNALEGFARSFGWINPLPER